MNKNRNSALFVTGRFRGIVAGIKRAATLALTLSMGALSNHAATLQWDLNPSIELVTNYVVRAAGPAPATSVATYNVGVTNAFDLSVLGAGQWIMTVLAQNFHGTSDSSLPVTYFGPPSSVTGITVTANWRAGAFDVVAQWQPVLNVSSYVAHLINTSNGQDLAQTVTNTVAAWQRVPAASYRMTVQAVSASGALGPVSTVNLGTIRPGRPQNLR